MDQSTRPIALVLEDEALIALDVEMTLSEQGFAVVLLSQCDQAEEWLRSNSPSVAVIDISLADGPCVHVANTLTERGVPFIVHSVVGEDSPEAHPAFSLGVWLSKPSMKEELVQAVRGLRA